MIGLWSAMYNSAQQKLLKGNFRDLNLKIHILLGKMKIVKECAVYFCTF